MTLQLKDMRLLKRKGYIDGKWVDADAGGSFAVTDPATGEKIVEVTDMGAAETRRAIDAAQRALPAWRAKPAKERAAVLRKWYDLILAHADDLALLMTTEQGKPLAEARGEVIYGASFVEWFAEEGRRAYGDVIPTIAPDRRLLAIKQPIGVCAAITPWNFPIAMITRKVAPAFAAGCTVVAKPAEATPLSALALMERASRRACSTSSWATATSRPRSAWRCAPTRWCARCRSPVPPRSGASCCASAPTP
jgi:succinate-semialdehyde dehydrogenase/glutarate-semialdehyde dehydrogenase